MTVEDIAEQLLGGLSGDRPVDEIAGGWTIDAALPVEDLAELMGADVPEGEWNTAAGLLMGLLGRLPEVGDEVDLDTHTLRVASKSGRRVTRIDVLRRTQGS